MGSKSSKGAFTKQLKSVLSAVPQFIPTHAVDVGLLDGDNNLVVSYSASVNSSDTFDSVHKETVSAMLRSITSFASTLSSERSEETEAVHLVGKDHICLLFPLFQSNGEHYLLVVWVECLDDDDVVDVEMSLQSAYEKLLSDSYSDLIGVVKNCAQLIDPASELNRKDKEKLKEKDAPKEKQTE
eukprot:TRINITY_DN107_c1_g4_i1.p1 TRINITY_DN107_c1_g4~~TRINITY_DN107_c1_g4_i1.p1  ORF type:complete len:184 (+),score=36.96 TRINITY_DN107_c1_g4_i1:216-767(+)